MDFRDLASRVARVRDVVAHHLDVGGWPHSVRIIAVTKTHGPETVRAAAAAGIRDMGENRVQEALQKQQALADLPVAWHLIGTLQKNKARHVAGRFELIHSVDRLDLARELDRRVTPAAKQPVLVQVNCSEEPQKGGVAPEELPALLEGLAELARLEVRGLMTLSALNADAAGKRGAFRRLRQARDAAEQRGHPLPELSMGMSDDYELAVEEGATMVRLGTVLFGERSQ